ncbi:hypothetical protein JQ035_11660 [Clostridium botulinum]|nr:hypothetical protein [Clostridium botulinum]
MRKPRTAEVTAYLQSDIKSVWNVVTNNNDYKWRSDIEKIEIINDEKEFIEYTPSGIATKFFITKKEECSQYKFSMGNKMFTGFWTGHFQKQKWWNKDSFCRNIFIKIQSLRFYLIFYGFKENAKYIYIRFKKKLGEQ